MYGRMHANASEPLHCPDAAARAGNIRWLVAPGSQAALIVSDINDSCCSGRNSWRRSRPALPVRCQLARQQSAGEQADALDVVRLGYTPASAVAHTSKWVSANCPGITSSPGTQRDTWTALAALREPHRPSRYETLHRIDFGASPDLLGYLAAHRQANIAVVPVVDAAHDACLAGLVGQSAEVFGIAGEQPTQHCAHCA
jgi:hypothetical protein